MSKRILATLLCGAWLGPGAALAAKPPAPKAPPKPPPIIAWVTPDGAPGEQCEAACLRTVAAKVGNRPGVKKAAVEGKEVKLEVVPGSFKAEAVIKGVDGMRVEMRVPYKQVEVHFVPEAPFPPVPTQDESGLLVVELSEDVRKALEAGLKYRPIDKLKCFGKLSGSQQNEVLLTRFETEKRPPSTMVPFLAEADLDGDRRPDLYFRLEGLPEVVLFNKKEGLKAVPVKTQRVDEIARCDQSPLRFARPVPKAKIKCLTSREMGNLGDAVERVEANRSNSMLMWTGKEFVSCEPLGQGALPPPPPKEGEEGQ